MKKICLYISLNAETRIETFTTMLLFYFQFLEKR